MVADALSKKSSGSPAHISVEKRLLIQELPELVDQGMMMKVFYGSVEDYVFLMWII